ncbi:MAG: rod shape-determining protein MreC [Gammaproteobacteria bacterium]|nr:rod shape-determining protein MreC [Gammaproteobacteria bacterium]
MVNRGGANRLFRRGPSLLTRTIGLMILAVVLMAADSQYNHLGHVRNILQTVATPIRWLAVAPVQISRYANEIVTSRRQLHSQNAKLSNQLLSQAIKLQQLAALEAENHRLRALMGSTPKVDAQASIAEVTAIDLDNRFRQRLVINQGKRSGVFIGQTVIDANGIVGQVLSIEPSSAVVILITDIEHAIAVETVRNGVRTILTGTGDVQQLDLPFLPNNTDIVVDDRLVASGLDGKFPAGYPVADIVSVTQQPGLPFAKVEAQPVAALDRLHEVLLLWPEVIESEPSP